MRNAPASDNWVASIEPTFHVIDRVVAVLVTVVGAVMGSPAVGGPIKDAVIRRRVTGEEVMRSNAGQDTVWMLDQLRRDLASMSEKSFAAKWQPGADWLIALRSLG